jgi:VWFA-related protein
VKKKLELLLAACLISVLFITQTGFSPQIQTPPQPEATPGPGTTPVPGTNPLPEALSALITQVDTSRFPEVTAYVSVTDANGEPVPVAPNQIKLLENGEEMNVDQVSATGDIGPLSTLLIIDTSGSMNHADKLKSAKAAATAYVNQARTSDQIGLVSFNTEVDYAQPLTTDRRKVLAAISALTAQGDTAMFDALGEGIAILESVSGRKAVIVMTDGLDNRSKLRPQQVLRLIGPQGLSISVIGLGDPSHSTGALTSLDEPALLAFSEEAGGAYGYANNADSLKALYEKYGRALQSEYIVTYTSPSQLRDGVNRALSASVADASGGVLGSNESPISYNPGGLIPEVTEPASWPLFLGLVIALVLLLFVPLFFLVLRPKARSANGGGGSKKSGVKLSSSASKPPPSSSSSKIKLKG